MRIPLALIVFVLWLTACPAVPASDFESRRQEMLKRFEQRRAEFRQRHNFGGSNTSLPATKSSTGTYGATAPSHSPRGSEPAFDAALSVGFTRQNTTLKTPKNHSTRMRGTSFDPLPYDAARAPSPDLCFLKFVDSARKATAITELFPYMPEAEVRVLKECEANHDPQVAAQHRLKFQTDNPAMTKESLDHLTGTPFQNELKRAKRIADKVIRVKKIRSIEGNKAELFVSTRSDAMSNAYGKMEKFPYSTADVEMLCEGSYWKFKSYNDNNISYKQEQ